MGKKIGAVIFFMDNHDIEDLAKIIVDLEERILINEKEIKSLKEQLKK